MIPKKLRLDLAIRANFRCEYCLIPEYFLATTFHVDHNISLKHGGSSRLNNLAFACPHCNQNKGTDIAAMIKGTGEGEEVVRFYNPRKDTWGDHFYYASGEILGKTLIAKSTVAILQFNAIERVILRQSLFEIGLYRFE